MAETSLAARLQVKRDRRLSVVDPPPHLDALLSADTPRAEIHEAEVALLFVRDRARLDAALPSLLSQLRPEAILWLAYPKLTSSLAKDLNRDIIRSAAPDFGLDTVSQIAIDDDWSALRLKRVA